MTKAMGEGGAALLNWCTAAEDDSAWVADPEPRYHLAAWRTAHGWDWHVVDPRGEVLARSWDEPTLETAQAQAEVRYSALVAATPGKAPRVP